jgi:hypothetical protein
VIAMDEIVQSIMAVVEREHAIKEAGDASDQSAHLYKRIRQLLRESNDAKEKGHWNKAQDLLLELSKITRAQVGSFILELFIKKGGKI